MKKHLYLFIGLSVLIAAALSAPALAMPEFADKSKAAAAQKEKFDKMDADKDGKVNWPEFSAAYPQMKEAAFEAIDKNNDKTITQEEWTEFTGGHSKDVARHNATGGETPPSAMPPSGMPPKGSGGVPETPTMKTMPLIEAPQK